MREVCCSIVSAVVFRLLFVFFIFQFGVVGATLGAMAGAVIGWNNKTRLMEGVITGIISGADLSFKLTKATFHHLHSDDDDDDDLAFFVRLVKLITRDMEKLLRQDEDKIMDINKELIWQRLSDGSSWKKCY